jgi:hypothetical protein
MMGSRARPQRPPRVATRPHPRSSPRRVFSTMWPAPPRAPRPGLACRMCLGFGFFVCLFFFFCLQKIHVLIHHLFIFVSSPDPRATLGALQAEVAKLREVNERLRREVAALRALARDLGAGDAADSIVEGASGRVIVGLSGPADAGGTAHPASRVIVPPSQLGATDKSGSGGARRERTLVAGGHGHSGGGGGGARSEGAAVSFLGFVFRSFWKILDPGFDAARTGPEQSV